MIGSARRAHCPARAGRRAGLDERAEIAMLGGLTELEQIAFSS
jgi:hypothetical protein